MQPSTDEHYFCNHPAQIDLEDFLKQLDRHSSTQQHKRKRKETKLI